MKGLNKLCSFLLFAVILTIPVRLYAKESNIYPKHPRIFLRPEKREGRIGVLELCKRVQFGDWCRGWERIKDGYAESRGIPTAAIGYLITDDEERAKRLIEMMKNASQNALNSSDIWDKNEIMNDLSIGFDWVYNSPSFSKEDKRILVENIVNLANRMIRYLNSDHHIFSRAMEQISSVGMIGIAIWGDHSDAEKFINFTLNELKNIFDAFRYLDGTWPEGVGYLNETRLPYLLEFLEAYKSATEPSYNYFEEIAENQGDWLRKLLYFHIYNLRPDNTWTRFGDISSYKAYPKDNFVQNLEIITTEYRNTYGSDLLVKLERGISPDPVYYKGYLFKYLLFHDPTIPVSPGIKELPLEAIFGKDSLGYIVIRSGWGPEDIFFRFNCGDYFTGHQHSDQGNFTIFKYAPLVIDSGYYADWGLSHRENYYTRTIAHNTMTIFQPEEKFQSPYKNAGINDGGQRVVWYYRGSAQQECFTLQEYLSRKKTGAHYETGDITNFEADNNYVYINADITNAYNNPEFSVENNKPKITEFKRQIVVLKPNYYFIIFDKVSSEKPEYKKAWLLHSIAEPTLVDGKLDNAGLGYAAYTSGTVRIDSGNGRLFCKTVYPRKSKITVIGGRGYEFWVNGYNRDQGVPLTFPPHSEPGAWRIEVQPTIPQKEDIFLHILYPCDLTVESIPEVDRIETDGGIGLQIVDRVVIFSKDKKKLSYQVNDNTLKHLVCNLQPNSNYTVMIKSLNTNKINQQLVTSTASGVLEFSNLSLAQQSITISLQENN
jgi:heparin/heparan-sulfate lyase